MPALHAAVLCNVYVYGWSVAAPLRSSQPPPSTPQPTVEKGVSRCTPGGQHSSFMLLQLHCVSSIFIVFHVIPSFSIIFIYTYDMLSLLKNLSSLLLSFIALTLASSFMSTFLGVQTKALIQNEWIVGAMVSSTYIGGMPGLLR